MTHLNLIDAINEKNTEKVKAFLSIPGIQINEIDDDGMSPLQHACFKGEISIVEVLLNVGADVNSNDHKMGYTALMFAALNGKEDVVHRLLNAGAKVHRTNSVGKTASQLAAFIGNHKIATIINNYVEKSNIAIFSIPTGVSNTVRLSPALVDSVHNIANEINFSPIKISLILRNNGLISSWKNIANTFDGLSRQNFDPHNTNEGLSIKFHLISFVCLKAGAEYDNGDKNLNDFIKKLFTADGQEKLLRQALKEFIHIESQLYRIIVSELCKITVGCRPSALEILSNRINGQGFFRNAEDVLECATCFTYSCNNRQCAGCSKVAYCNVECQKLHWFTHKKFCRQYKNKPMESAIIDECDYQSSGLEYEGGGECDVKCRSVSRE